MKELISMLSVMPDPAVIIDTGMRIAYQNDASKKLFGDNTGNKCYACIEDSDRVCDDCPAALSFNDGNHRSSIREPRMAAEKSHRYLLSVSPIRDGQEEVSNCVLFFREITSLNIQDKHKRDLLSMLSHDLKAPMTIIHSCADLLLDSFNLTGDEEKDMLGRIKSSALKYTRLLDDFITLSKIESGGLALDLKAGSVSEIAALCADDLSVLARQKEIKIHTDLPCDLPEVRIDDRHYGRAVSNVIANAIKYSDIGGRIWVRAGVEGDGDKKVFVEVSDEGPGIPENELPHIMESYYRSDRPGKAHGTGLGLAIVKALTELHDGSVEVRNRDTRGVSVKISIPLPNAPDN